MDRITYRTNRQMLEQIEEIIRQLRIDVNNLTKRIDKLEEKMNNEQMDKKGLVR
jgi:DNA-binding MarR family transcriptional regulator